MKRAFGIDRETELMDRHVMVVPTESHEVLRIVVTTPMLLPDVVRLQPVAAVASFDGASSLVSLQYEGSNGRWDCFVTV